MTRVGLLRWPRSPRPGRGIGHVLAADQVGIRAPRVRSALVAQITKRSRLPVQCQLFCAHRERATHMLQARQQQARAACSRSRTRCSPLRSAARTQLGMIEPGEPAARDERAQRPSEGQCGFYLRTKRRFCRQQARQDSQYCEHHGGVQQGAGRKRVQCPYDAKQCVCSAAPVPPHGLSVVAALSYPVPVSCAYV